jgi:hypothetical protein
MAFQFGFVCIALSADGADVRLKRKQKDNDNKVQSEMLKIIKAEISFEIFTYKKVQQRRKSKTE